MDSFAGYLIRKDGKMLPLGEAFGFSQVDELLNHPDGESEVRPLLVNLEPFDVQNEEHMEPMIESLWFYINMFMERLALSEPQRLAVEEEIERWKKEIEKNESLAIKNMMTMFEVYGENSTIEGFEDFLNRVDYDETTVVFNQDVVVQRPFLDQGLIKTTPYVVAQKGDMAVHYIHPYKEHNIPVIRFKNKNPDMPDVWLEKVDPALFTVVSTQHFKRPSPSFGH